MGMHDDPHLGDNLQALESLADMGYLGRDTPAFGIAKMFVHEGEDRMSPKQREIFKKHVASVIFHTCQRCGEEIELWALPDAYDQDLMLCSYHQHKHHKGE
jgi:hypothetical protein